MCPLEAILVQIKCQWQQITIFKSELIDVAFIISQATVW